MFGQKVIEQIDEYLKLYTEFEKTDLSDCFAEVIKSAGEIYDAAIERAKRAQNDYKQLQSEYDALNKKPKHYSSSADDLKSAKEEYERISAAIAFAQMDIDKNNKSITRAEKEIETLEATIASRKMMFWKNNAEEKKKIESAKNRIEKRNKENKKLSDTIRELREQLVLAESNFNSAQKFSDEANCAESNRQERLSNIKDALIALKAVIEETNTESVFDEINDANIVANFDSYNKIYNSEINAANLGKNGTFVDLKRVLSLIESTPFNYKENEYLKLPDSFSAPCQDYYEKLISWSCHGQPIKESVAFKFITSGDSQFTDALDKIIDNYGFKNNISNDFSNENITERPKGDGLEYEIDTIDPLLRDAALVFVRKGQVSAAILHSELKLGYARAARIIGQLEEKGIISSYEGDKPRRLLVSAEQVMKIIPNIKPSDFKDKKNAIPDYNIEPKEQIIAKCIYDASFWILSVDFLNKIKEVIESKPNINLPDLALELLKITKTNGLEKYVLKFKELYNATPDQIMVANQRYFLEKQLEEQEIERKENEIDAMIRCQNCLHYENCRTVGSVGCGSYFPL